MLVIVEDEVIIGLSLCASLFEVGFDTRLFPDAASALRFLETVEVDAAIIDIGLPGMRGDELARNCRARFPGLPIVLDTGYDEHSYAETAAVDPLLCVLGKPFDIPRLLIRLEELGVYPSPSADGFIQQPSPPSPTRTRSVRE